MIKTELYFGLSIGTDGKRITAEAFAKFLDAYVVDGVTVIDGLGQFKMDSGTLILEKTKIVVIVHSGLEVMNQAIDRIRDRYKGMFSQESVMRVDQEITVSF